MKETVPERIDIRDEKGRLAKGSNLNPTGLDRRRALMLRKLESLTPKALSALERLVDDESPENRSVRLGAAREILDRTMGKPKQSVSVDVTSTSALHLQALQELADRARIAEQRTIDITPIETPVEQKD
jgi:hypothetical protein